MKTSNVFPVIAAIILFLVIVIIVPSGLQKIALERKSNKEKTLNNTKIVIDDCLNQKLINVSHDQKKAILTFENNKTLTVKLYFDQTAGSNAYIYITE